MKISRLLGITVLLLNREKMTARELSRYFEVSERTILRDIETLSEAGIPVLTIQGAGGGIGFVDGYTLDRQFLSFGELSSVVTALRGIVGLFDVPGCRDALEKIEALVPKSRRRDLSAYRDMIDFDFRPWNWSAKRSELPGHLLEAVRSRRTVRFRYLNSAGESLERTVEPLRLTFRGSAWYLIAFCRLRGGLRVFRLSRIRDFSVGREVFAPRTVPEDYFGPASDAKPPVLRMTLRFDPKMRFLVEESFEEGTYRDDEDGFILVRTEYPESDWIYGFLLSFGDQVTVVEPEEIREKIAEKAKKIVRLYKT